MKTTKTILALAFALLQFTAWAHKEPVHTDNVKLVKNLNQHDARVLYSAELKGGAFYLERTAFTYVFYNAADLERLNEYLHDAEYVKTKSNESPRLRGHAYKVHFEGANPQATITEGGQYKEYYNYILGQDESKWAGNVPLFKQVLYNNFYPGTDLKVYSTSADPEYDFIVHAGADISQIALRFEGTDGISIKDGNLEIKTSVSTIIEQKPLAYQIINGKWQNVPCAYHLDGNRVRFNFPAGYNKAYDLVIDPVIVASTYSGTTYRAYAHTATYDDAGNIYSAGRAFSVNTNGSGAGYQATTGAFQTTHAGGFQDICVSKYNPTGSQLIWATYIGGSLQEQPHSLVVNANQQLYIYGSSNSANYPVSATGYQKTNPTDNFGNHLSDIIVTKLNAAGSALLGSTYVGGRSEQDGISWSSVQRYYGDAFKGEIVIDSNDNAYIASYAQASDFPTTTGAIQTTYGGGKQDGVIFKLNSNLSNLVWSTFLGGPLEDACYGLKLDKNGNLFVTGAMSSNILAPTSAGAIHPSYIGGLFDGFVAHIRADGQAILKSTYFGSINEEQAYLIDLDRAGNVYIFGATPNNSIQPTPGAYDGVIRGSFIAKINPTLDTLGFVTTFNQLAPTALMVDECDHIYAVGHGGLNTSAGTLSGFQLTPDAFLTGSGGFYLMTLYPNATALKFGSYYGPASSHVDGGTCRFSKKGVMYHALCTDKTTFYTTPTAWRTTKQSNDFDNCVFKVDFESTQLTANGLATLSGTIDTAIQVNSCSSPATVQFVNYSQNATTYVWYFGNGDSSTVQEPAYTFPTAGTYNVTLVARNPATCNQNDTATISVNVSATTAGITVQSPSGCGASDGTATVNITNGTAVSYLWNNNDNTATITGLGAGTYTVTVTVTGGCTVTATATVAGTGTLSLTATATATTCTGNTGSATVHAIGTGPFTFAWSNSGGSDSTATGLAAGTYTVTVTTSGCTATATVTVGSSGSATATFNVTQPSCGLSNGIISVSGTFTTYEWKESGNLIGSGPQVSGLGGGTYTFHGIDANGCTVDSSFIFVSSGGTVTITTDKTIMCAGDSAQICAPAGYSNYAWNGGQSGTACIYTKQPGNFYVTVTDNGNCTVASNSVSVAVRPLPPVSLSVNGDTMTVYNSVTRQWYLNGNPIPGATDTVYIALQPGSYTVAVTDANGCRAVSNAVNITSVGIAEIYGNKGLSVYPNPFTGSFDLQIFDYNFASPLKVEIFDAIGRKVSEQIIYNAITTLQLTQVAAGVYVLRVEGKGFLRMEKIVKK